MAKTHKDLEFHVDTPSGTKVVKNFNEATGLAVSLAASTGQEVKLDVVAWSRSAARHYAGDDGVQMYEEDPEASVFDRIVIRAESKGRIA